MICNAHISFFLYFLNNGIHLPFGMVRVRKLPRELSGHNPLILETVPDNMIKNIYVFHFEIGMVCINLTLKTILGQFWRSLVIKFNGS